MESIKAMRLIAIVLLCTLPTGCSEENPLPKVHGLVTLDGQSLPNATVSFYPASGRAVSAKTDNSGQYRLKLLPNKSGVAEGNYTVTISTYMPSQLGKNDKFEAVMVAGTPELLPEKYTSRKTTDLVQDVKTGDNECNFALQSEVDNSSETDKPKLRPESP
ncbi:MAG: carboxypeptidase-like regulatory domain-containing protein [Pseudomonadota bacterium]